MGIRNGAFYTPSPWSNNQPPAIDATALKVTEEYVATITHENMLLNWDFTNSISNKLSTSGSAAAFWQVVGAETTASTDPNGLTVKGTVRQRVRFGITRGRFYTVSVSIAGEVSAANLYVPTTGIGEAEFDFGKVSLGYSESSFWLFAIEATEKVTIEKIKLEAGLYSTLRASDRPDKSIEMSLYNDLDDYGSFVPPVTTRSIAIAIGDWSGTASPFVYSMTIDGLQDADIVLIRADDNLYTDNKLSYAQSGSQIQFSVDFKPTDTANIGIGIIKAKGVI